MPIAACRSRSPTRRAGGSETPSVSRRPGADRHAPGNIEFRFDAAGELWQNWINSQFGEGIITWNTPFLFRTKPEGSRLLVCGPPNYFKRNAHPLTALIESDWISMSFTMNWKIMVPNQPVRFEQGEPLFQAIPLVSNICADLETADVSYQKLTDNPELYRAVSANGTRAAGGSTTRRRPVKSTRPTGRKTISRVATPSAASPVLTI